MRSLNHMYVEFVKVVEGFDVYLHYIFSLQIEAWSMISGWILRVNLFYIFCFHVYMEEEYLCNKLTYLR